MNKILVLLLFTCPIYAQTQSKIIYRDIVDDCVVEKSEKSREAFLVKKDNKLGRAIFDSIVEDCVKGKYIADYSFKTVLSCNRLTKN